MFEHVLFTLNELDDPVHLYPHLRRIARPGSSRVTVMQSAPFLETVLEMPNELSPDVRGDEEAAELFVDALVDHLQSDGFQADGFSDIGHDALIIGAAAERVDASIILMTLRRRSPLEALHRITPIPILAVPLARRRSSQRILVPIDDASSLEAIPYAGAMARRLRAGVTFVAAENHALLPQARDLAHRELVATESTLVAEDMASTLLSLSGVMIVLRSWTEEMMERLVREGDIPLLLIRRPLVASDRGPLTFVPQRARIASALWTRRVPSNPLQGIGEP